MDLPDSRKRERYNTVNLPSSMLVTLFGIVTVPVRPDPLKAHAPIVRSALPGSKIKEVRDLHNPKAADSGEREVWAR